ncbi:serine/threonine-protein kinase Nek4 isoform X1 [Latimeria chalumnae]|uniref:serine/threonine-protein kinase Nek4 isoform X1 n=2 Tax=Latimeria chalumnae TaxID=7897 RepID=UPI0006D8E497|nr:PREDICTED: serine/threonine-protein kinase Nek4 isoform X1 [Latimeria chalumnae]|eukprot:XP_014354511.1 PREDICTED: serine/threonine-protein kinase Nek4 isoform X1 [Latimeria chalumnae]
MESYSFRRAVGKGSYGEVNLVRRNSDGKQYVIKKLNLRNASSRERKAAEQEAQLLSQLKHPNIVTYRESWEGEDGQLYIVMGFCEGGDLYHKLKEQKGKLLPENQVVEWFVQIAMALQYLHEKHILHRDLKTQNIFLTRTSIIKVGDLGIARVLENQYDMASTLIGTPYYMSPELFSNKPYNYKSDVWALGCCVYEMATLKHAFNAKDMNSLVYRIIEGKLPAMPKDYSPHLGELIRSMLSKTPEERPDVKTILRQPYIKRQISLFLEATKAKTAKNRKKASDFKPNNAASMKSDLECNQESGMSPQLGLDPSRKYKANEEKPPEEPKCDHSDPGQHSAAEITPDSQQSASKADLNTTGTSLATVSNVDIDILPVSEVKNPKSDHLIRDKKMRHPVVCDEVEPRRPLTCAQSNQARPYRGAKLVAKAQSKPNKQTEVEIMEEKDDTMKLLQPISKEPWSEEKESLDSTEKLLEPFNPVIVIEENSHQAIEDPVEKKSPLQPYNSVSEPSISQQQRHKRKPQVEENLGKRKAVVPRPLPSPPRRENKLNVKKARSNADKVSTEVSHSMSSSKDSVITASQDRPLSARERRRLKQSQEDFCPSVPSGRRTSHSVVLEAKSCVEKQHIKVGRSSSDCKVSQEKKPSILVHGLSDDDDFSSSTSSTDKSEGDLKEGKSDSNEMHDLVQLMTQTLKMDSRSDHAEHPSPKPLAEFKLHRKYRDTLILHGITKEEPEEFRFSDLPSDTVSVSEKIRRTIEALRADVVQGLGVKLLERVYDIMEEDDEIQKECLREHMGEKKYDEYSLKARQLKFLEDNAHF